MLFSVVTISFNQAPWLGACLDSVAQQAGPWEHIIADPGSTDGSREVIAAHKEQFAHIILEKDNGPADGLNRGFARARGDIFCYLNSDDVFLPNAFAEARAFLTANREVDVLCGHALVIDAEGSVLRKVWSDPISRHSLAHGGSIQIQPSTFIRRAAFERVGGFRTDNTSSWDAELIFNLFVSGAQFAIQDSFWSGYRIHPASITASGRLKHKGREWSSRRYEALMHRPEGLDTQALRQAYRLARALRHPSVFVSRLRGIRVNGGG